MGANKINSITLTKMDAQTFFKALDECKGNVYLIDGEGNRLNLKSKLCQVYGFMEVLKGAELKDAVIQCDNEEDDALLFRLNLYGDK